MANGDSIVYVYGAGGSKLQKLVYENSSLTASTHYAGAYVYKDELLNFIQSAEGRITKTTSEFVYEYHLKDHIGNVRVAFIDNNGTPKVIQESDYYPFCLRFGEQRIGNDNKYLFSGKEQQDDVVAGVSLDWYDYGARMYSAELGRWHAADPANQYHSPYVFVQNDPINYFDADGKWGNPFKAISKAVKNVGSAAKNVVNKAADVVTGTVKKTGEGIKNTINNVSTVGKRFKNWSNKHNIDDLAIGAATFLNPFTSAITVASLTTGVINGVAGFFDKSVSGGEAWSRMDPTKNGTICNNALKLNKGLFAADKNQAGWGKQILSRLTWELPQTLTGYISSQTINTLGRVRSINTYSGASIVETYGGGWGAMSLGSYILGNFGIEALATDELFQHEFGHYLQSQKFGLFYLSKFGIPSALSSGDYFDYGNHPVEQDANVRALKYFMKNEDDFGLDDWNFNRADGGHPITGFDENLSWDNPANQNALRNGTMGLEWFDFVHPNPLINGVITSIINTIVLNRRNR